MGVIHHLALNGRTTDFERQLKRRLPSNPEVDRKDEPETLHALQIS
jgi:hypothetical protein